MTPMGPSDKCIEALPELQGAIPNKSRVTVLVCMDGKNDVNRKEVVDVPFRRTKKDSPARVLMTLQSKIKRHHRAYNVRKRKFRA